MSVGHQNKATRGNKDDAIEGLIQNAMKDSFANLPGEIVSFDSSKQIATVKSMYKPTVDGKAQLAPELVDIPVNIQRGGGFCMTLPLKAGDNVQLGFEGRDLTFLYTI